MTCAIYVRMVLYYSSHPPTLPLGTCIYTVLRRRRAKPLQITHSIISHIYLSLLPYSFFMNVQVILFVTHSLYIFDAMCENQHVLLVGAHSLLSSVEGCESPQVATCTLIHIQLEKLSPLATVQPGVQALQDKLFNSSIHPSRQWKSSSVR